MIKQRFIQERFFSWGFSTGLFSFQPICLPLFNEPQKETIIYCEVRSSHIFNKITIKRFKELLVLILGKLGLKSLNK